MRARFLSAAESEMAEAASYYESQSVDLGRQFLMEVERSLDAVKDYPRAGTPLGDMVRRRLLQTFPFALLYVDTSDEIVVVAVMDLRRKPDYWKDRL